ncbi:MAG TPA: fumarylacetoacetate hydrolase family protein [Bryobacteraceae bacterium]|jgi:2-keto-4-pentenoate hydratase/2-oxohepta-3-ene-1,7-dioic acid hydratase in catechol pathway
MATFARFEKNGRTSYGIATDGKWQELRGGLFDPQEPTGRQFTFDEVKLLTPCEPPKILAVGQNYTSHLGERKTPSRPEMFYKPISSLQHPDGPIELPADAEDAHYEGELVVVMGKAIRNATREEAAAGVFGITCGNDVSDRNWQRGPGKDVQYWRAKGCDTFAPLGPVIVTGLDYSDLLLTTRVNGQVAQQQRTSDLIFDVPTVLSFISHYVTLVPGDVIYTGTPGNTRAMHPGDVVEVEIEGIGTLRNPVVSRSKAV